MNLARTILSQLGLAAMVVGMASLPAKAASLGASYYSMTPTDPDVGNNQGIGALLTTVGAGLGPNGLPIVNLASSQGQQLHDVNSTTHELEWWSPALNSHVTVLNNPVYPSAITLPFVDNNMYTNTTILGQNGNDANSFLTAEFVGNFSLSSAGSVGFNVCSDDDEFVYLSGGAFGNGTLVVDNGGIHATSCTSGNVNTSLLNNVSAGNYTLTVFYDDREQVGAAFQLSSTLNLTPPPSSGTPEPATLSLLGLGFGGLAWAGMRKHRRSSK